MPRRFKQRRQRLRLLDGRRAHQHRPADLVQLRDLVGDGVQLLLLGLVDDVVVVQADQRLVGRDDHDVQVVDLGELRRLGVGRPGHARQLAVHAEVVLDRDGGQGLVLPLDLHLLPGFHRLVQPVAPPAPGHQATGELVHDDDLAVLHHVVHVPLVQGVGPQPLLDVVDDVDVGRLVEVLHPQQLLHREDAGLGEGHGPGLLVHDVVPAGGGLDLVQLAGGDGGRALQAGDDPVDGVVLVRGLLRRARDDQRGPGLVDEDVVHLVHDAVVELALDELRRRELHVVAQVIEPELAVGPVGDVGPVGLLPRAGPEVRHAHVGRAHRRVEQVGRLVLEDAHREPQGVVDGPHPLGVPLGQVVVDRDDVDPLAGEGVEVHRQGGHQGLALARGHLGDLPLVQDHAADELHVEVAHVQHAPGHLAAEGEGLGQDLVQDGLDVPVPFGRRLGHLLAKAGRPGLEILLAQALHLGLEGIDGLDPRAEARQFPFVLGADDLMDQAFEHEHPSMRTDLSWKAVVW